MNKFPLLSLPILLYSISSGFCLGFSLTLNLAQSFPPAGSLLSSVISRPSILISVTLLSAINNISVRPWTDPEPEGWPKRTPHYGNLLLQPGNSGLTLASARWRCEQATLL